MPPDRQTRIDRILEQQDADLQSLEDRQAERFLLIYEAARQDLRERLGELERSGRDEDLEFTAQHLRVMLAQSEAGIRQMEVRLNRQLDEAVREAQDAAFENLVGVIKSAEPDFRDTGNRIEHAVLKRFAEERTLQLHRFSTRRYAADVLDEIQRELSLGVATGRTIPEMRDRIFDRHGSAMASKRSRAELIVRMELNTAYNRNHQAATEEAEQAFEETDSEAERDPLLKKVDEFRDLRNHAISRALDRQVVPVREPFRVLVTAVRAEHEKLQAQRAAAKLPRRRLGGIVWPIEGGMYRGMTHPAHYFDRGRQVPWRKSWGPGRAAPPMPSPPAPAATATRPSSPPGEDRTVRGPRKEAPPGKKSEKAESIRLENDAGDILARAGYDVEHLYEDSREKDKAQPDYRIEGRIFDAYAPLGEKPKKARNAISRKVRKQADRIIVHMGRNEHYGMADVMRELEREPVTDLKELFFIVDGEIVRAL